jgi:hypothetical protein
LWARTGAYFIVEHLKGFLIDIRQGWKSLPKLIQKFETYGHTELYNIGPRRLYEQGKLGIPTTAYIFEMKK